MTIVFRTHLAGDYPELIREFADGYPEHRFVTDVETVPGWVETVDVLVDHRADAEFLKRAGRLKWVCVPFAGTESLPKALLDEHGVRYRNSHGNAPAVAERALALALAAMGRVCEFDRGLRRGYWHRRKGREPFIFWNSLAGKRVCILGTGAIGKKTAEYVSVFTQDITGFARRPIQEAPAPFRRVTTDLEDALNGADLCVAALPLSDSTRGLLGSEELALLEGGCLVNVGRGEVVQEEALFQALSRGILGSAGLDVWYRYPESFDEEVLPSRLPFHTLENLVLSPHAASHCREGKQGQLKETLHNLRDILDGRM